MTFVTEESSKTEDDGSGRPRSLSQPVKNPFASNLRLGFKDILIFILMSISIAPLRFIALLFFQCFAWLLCYLEFVWSGDRDADKPISKPERHAFYSRLIGLVGRINFVFGGFFVTVVGKVAPPSEAPVIVVAPHSTMFDGVVLPYANLPAVVSKIENKNLPLFGILISFLRPIFVSRAERASRTATMERIKARIAAIQSNQPGYNRHLLMFPEGTCTNRSCLITFKSGAFIAGVPVQPVVLKFHNPLDTYSWTSQGLNAVACAWLSLCQPINRVTVEFLPVYKPSPEEVKDCDLFARNVRAVMAERLGIPTTDYTYEDSRLK